MKISFTYHLTSADQTSFVYSGRFFKKVRNTIFTYTRKRIFPECLCFLIKVFKKNFMVFKKICYIYPTVHQFWSNAHQLVKISVIVTGLSFFSTFFIQPIFKSTRQILTSVYFRWNWYQTTKYSLILQLMFSSSFIDFEKVFK